VLSAPNEGDFCLYPTHTSTEHAGADSTANKGVSVMVMTPKAATGPLGGSAHLGSHFWRHFAEMFGVMVGGMIASAAVFLTIVQMTWDEATREHPMASLLVIAAGMTIPMAAWMLYRGMGSRNTGEMSAAMALPAIPFLCLVWFGVTDSAFCGPYCILAIVGMLALMLWRRAAYDA
jgi:hypothetical protein